MIHTHGKFFIYTTAENINSIKYNNIISNINNFDLKIIGVSSNNICYIENIYIIINKNKFYLKIQIDSPQNKFYQYEGVKIYSEILDDYITESVVNIVSINIESAGYGYEIGDIIYIGGCNINGLAKVKTLKNGEIQNLTIVNGGDGYEIGDIIINNVINGRGHSFSAIVKDVIKYNNYLKITYNPVFNIENVNFTIECFIYKNRYGEKCICGNITDVGNRGWSWKIDTNNKIVFNYQNIKQSTSTGSIDLNKWHHISTVRNGNTISHYIDGVLSGQSTISNGILSNNDFTIGKDYLNNNYFEGYISVLRLTKNISRYTTDFDINDLDFSINEINYNDVTLLMYFDGNDKSNVFVDNSTHNHSVMTIGNVIHKYKINTYTLNNTCVYFSGNGYINKVEIINSGYDYDTLPTLIVKSQNGRGVNIITHSDNIGRIGSIEYIEPYVDARIYNDIIFTTNSDHGVNATFTPLFDTIFTEKYQFKNYNGILGINTILHDSYYYQHFSYELRSQISRNIYDDVIDEWLHPVGYIRFSVMESLYKNESPLLSDNSIFSLTNIISIYGGSIINLSFLSNVYDIELTKRQMTLNNYYLFNNMTNLEYFKNSDNFNTQIKEFDELKLSNINNISKLNHALDVELEIIVV